MTTTMSSADQFTATATATATGTAITAPSSSLLVCAIVDGSIYTLDAWTGAVTSVVRTGRPLVSWSSPRVIPALDGTIYHYDESFHHIEHSISIQDVLHHPVKSCGIVMDDNDDNNDNNIDACGIVTATKVTSLFGLQAHSGELVWTSTAETTNGLWQQHVVLQREDFLVQHISTTTGKELWNVTLGQYSALDFNDLFFQQEQQRQTKPGSKETIPLLDSDDVPDMPDILFDELGQMLTVVFQDRILWKRQLHSTIASVYGIGHGHWVPLNVLDDSTDIVALDHDNVKVAKTLPQLPSTDANDAADAAADAAASINDYFRDLVWQQHPQHQQYQQYTSVNGGVVLYQPLKIRPACDENGVCEPIPAAPPPKYLMAPSPARQPALKPPPPSLLLSLAASPPPPPPPTTITHQGGLFVTWTMVWTFIALCTGTAVYLVFWYQHKKKTWGTPNLTSTNPNSHDLPTTLHLDSSLSNAPRNLIAMPILEQPHSLTQQQQEDSKPPTVSSPKSESTKEDPPQLNHMDGIPLVRYSRYKSEFKELAALGRGGFGSVFSCENVLDGRHYAMKKIIIQQYDDPQATKYQLQRVLREVKILALLDHPNIVRYYTAWLELEDYPGGDHKHHGGDNESYMTDSKLMTKCYSSECLTTTGARERPSQMGRTKLGSPAKASKNPLGWNNFLNEYSSNTSFQRNAIHGSFTSMDGFTFDRGDDESNMPRNASSFSSAGGILRTIHDTRRHDDDNDHDHDSVSFSEEASVKGTLLPQEQLTPKQSNQLLRHTLYIQMQLCSQKSLQDFLSNPEARRGNEVHSIDIPFALSLFGQVAQGVHHVHKQGLIHRDLKPSNCFMDDIGVVKVGDFGLSRESTATPDQLMTHSGHGLGGDADNTAGVGTRSYASPEQMNGSDYDASTDVYSLGILLFELCYPMYTGMERHIVLARVRNRDFPDTWKSSVAKPFPELQTMLEAMLSPKPMERPSAETVASYMKSLMSEFTVQSIDKAHGGATLLRVEAASNDEGILNRTIKLIKDVAPSVKIEQYGLRGGERSAIMEFALSTSDDGLRAILTTMRETKEIKLVRQVSHNLHPSK
jgi:serine/threonine protein kinase